MHIGHRDFGPAATVLSPAVTYRVAGEHALAGTFSGREEVCSHLSDVVERTMGTMDAIKWEDWMLGEHHIAAWGEVHVRSKGRVFSGRRLIMLRFDVDDKIDEVIVLFEDQRAIERFLGDE
jgi:hypothetical protein